MQVFFGQFCASAQGRATQLGGAQKKIVFVRRRRRRRPANKDVRAAFCRLEGRLTDFLMAAPRLELGQIGFASKWAMQIARRRRQTATATGSLGQVCRDDKETDARDADD